MFLIIFSFLLIVQFVTSANFGVNSKVYDYFHQNPKFQSNLFPKIQWIFLQYHKTGHDLVMQMTRPFSKFLCSDLSVRKDSEKYKSLILDCNISILRAAFFDPFLWIQPNMNLNSSRLIRLVHFIREPVDMIISGFLFHSEVPVAEDWLDEKYFNPCSYPYPLFEMWEHTKVQLQNSTNLNFQPRFSDLDQMDFISLYQNASVFTQSNSITPDWVKLLRILAINLITSSNHHSSSRYLFGGKEEKLVLKLFSLFSLAQQQCYSLMHLYTPQTVLYRPPLYKPNSNNRGTIPKSSTTTTKSTSTGKSSTVSSSNSLTSPQNQNQAIPPISMKTFFSTLFHECQHHYELYSNNNNPKNNNNKLSEFLFQFLQHHPHPPLLSTHSNPPSSYSSSSVSSTSYSSLLKRIRGIGKMRANQKMKNNNNSPTSTSNSNHVNNDGDDNDNDDDRDEMLDGLWIEFYRSIFSEDKRNGADLLRMVVNTFLESKFRISSISPDQSFPHQHDLNNNHTSSSPRPISLSLETMRASLSDFPLGDRQQFTSSATQLFSFLMSKPSSKNPLPLTVSARSTNSSMKSTPHQQIDSRTSISSDKISSVDFWKPLHSLDSAVSNALKYGFVSSSSSRASSSSSSSTLSHIASHLTSTKLPLETRQHYSQLLLRGNATAFSSLSTFPSKSTSSTSPTSSSLPSSSSSSSSSPSSSSISPSSSELLQLLTSLYHFSPSPLESLFSFDQATSPSLFPSLSPHLSSPLSLSSMSDIFLKSK